MFVKFKIHFYSLVLYISFWMIANRLKHEHFPPDTCWANSFSVVFSHSEGWNVNIFQPAALYLKEFISRHPAWLKNQTQSSGLESGSVQKWWKNQYPTERPKFFSTMDSQKGWARLGMTVSWIQHQLLYALTFLE